MSWLLAFAGFALLVILHELGHFLAAKAVGMRVERFALFFPPLLFRVKRGETEYAIGAIPLGGYVRITGMSPTEEIEDDHKHRAYHLQPVWKRIFVIAAGPLMNILVAFVVLAGLYVSQGISEPSTRVAAIERGQPASGVLRLDDRVLSVDGVTGDVETLTRQIGTHRCAGTPVDGCAAATPAVVVVDRDGQRVTLRLTPRYDAQAVPPRPRIGLAFGSDQRDVGIVRSADLSVDAMWNITTATVSAITRLVYDSEARQEVSGIVGSYETTRQAVEVDWVRAMQILAIISLSLAIVNLFPFLPLDGGHIFWALAEKLRRRPIPVSVMERASVVGFVLVIMLFAVGLTNDIDRLRGEGFDVR